MKLPFFALEGINKSVCVCNVLAGGTINLENCLSLLFQKIIRTEIEQDENPNNLIMKKLLLVLLPSGYMCWPTMNKIKP